MARNKDVLQEKSNPNWFFRVMLLPFHRNPGCFSEKRQPQKRISRKRVAISSEHILMCICSLAGRRAGVLLWPVVCPMPAGGSAVKGRQRGRWLPVAERASPLTALQAAGTKPGAKRRAQIRTAAYRGTPIPAARADVALRIQAWNARQIQVCKVGPFVKHAPGET